MADEENKETSENIPPEDNDSDGSATGPVAEDDSSSSQAAGEEPSSTPPAAETSEAEQPQGDAPEEQPQDEAPAEEPDAGPVAEQAQDEAPAAEQGQDEGSQGDGAPAEGGGRAAEQPADKGKKDVIPGADLEPIAVEPEAELSAEERARKEAEEEERAKREAELTRDADEEGAPAREPAKMESGARFLATGKRKSSIARVILTPGSGKIEVNQRGLEEFFPRPLHQTVARQALTATGYEGSVDVRVRVHGGGVSGQAGAVRHGIARALTEVDPQLRGELKRRGFLTRDARVKERRKAGLKKARKRPQFSKR
jgi:small subunit ribosomal protein S9